MDDLLRENDDQFKDLHWLLQYPVCSLEIIDCGVFLPSDKKINLPQYMSISIQKYTLYCVG